MIWQTVALLTLLPAAGRLPAYARLVAGLVGDDRVPASRKALLVAAIGYAVSPLDVIPDRIPVLGILDDVVVAALGMDAFLAGVPDDVLDERLATAGLPRSTFDDDIRRVRRLVPPPIRRIVHRIPAALALGARVVHDAGPGLRRRTTISQEGSPA
ncbi:MAG: DUF1232 domain-containing protein [Chloroflexi bacterium]|jgi:uncharacterized membrane protein YkvA (DUF1232 family)|nr:DUF1232 domain-containing protein [Chloroflexota bacterium]